MSVTNRAEQWLKTASAARALDISPATLLRKRVPFTKDGYFKSGVHYLKSGEKSNCAFSWNINAIKEVFANWEAPTREG